MVGGSMGKCKWQVGRFSVVFIKRQNLYLLSVSDIKSFDILFSPCRKRVLNFFIQKSSPPNLILRMFSYTITFSS